MMFKPETYSPCHRCRTLRPLSKLLAGACIDGFCGRVLEVGHAAATTEPELPGGVPSPSPSLPEPP